MNKKVNTALKGVNKTNRFLSSVDVSLRTKDAEYYLGHTGDSSSLLLSPSKDVDLREGGRAPPVFITDSEDFSSSSAGDFTLPPLTGTAPPAHLDEDGPRRALRRVRETRRRQDLLEDSEENGGPGYVQERISQEEEDRSRASISAPSTSDGTSQYPRERGGGGGTGDHSPIRVPSSTFGDRDGREGMRGPKSSANGNNGKATNVVILSGAGDARRTAILAAARAAVKASRMVGESAAAKNVGVNFRHFDTSVKVHKRGSASLSSSVDDTSLSVGNATSRDSGVGITAGTEASVRASRTGLDIPRGSSPNSSLGFLFADGARTETFKRQGQLGI